MTKPESCIGCALYQCPGPVEAEFTSDLVDILFCGEAPGAIEIIKSQPMVGEAGQVLRRTIKEMGYASYGITNVARCKPPGNEFPGIESIGKYCKLALQQDLLRCTKIVVPLGATALHAITNLDVGITQVQGRLFSSNGHTVLPMYHPSYLRRAGAVWRDWELCHSKLSMFLNGHRDYIPAEQRIVEMLHSPDEVFMWLTKLQDSSYTSLAFDIETSAGYAPWAGAHILALSIGWSETHSIAFMWDDLLDNSRVLLQQLFDNKSCSWYNGQYDAQFLFADGFKVRIDDDVMLRAHIVDERGSSDETTKGGIYHALKRDSAFYLDADNWEYDLKQYAPNKEDDYSVIPQDKLLRYNGLDTIHTYHLGKVLNRIMEEEETTDYYEHVEVPTFNMLARARYVGIRVDVRRVQALQNEMTPVLRELEHRMIEISGDQFFNPNSPQQVKKVMWNRNYKVADTRKETLTAYEGDEFVDAMRDYRDCSKMKSTYVDGLANDIYDDLRVHPDWRLPTETGRPRCSSPNLLGMPRKAEIEEHRWKRYIKEQFISDPGTVFLHLDRKQSEVRCMVFLADCIDFIKHLIAEPKADIHGEFTKMLYGAGYTKEQRVLVKMIVFGLIYNREAASLAAQFTAIEREKARKEGKTTWKVWSIREAQKFINDFFALFPEMLVYKNKVMKEALKNGILRGYLGRLRRFGLVNYENTHHISNEAVNFMPSNLSADLNFISCFTTMQKFGKYGVEVLVPIHDAGLLRIPSDSLYLKDEIVNHWEGLVKNELTRPGLPLASHDPSLPFPVDCTCGQRWSDL